MTEPHVGMRIRIKDHAPFFPGKIAYIAYIGSVGVSVYLASEEGKGEPFDDCIPLNSDEWEPAPKGQS